MARYRRLALRATGVAFPVLALLSLIAALTREPERAGAKVDAAARLEPVGVPNSEPFHASGLRPSPVPAPEFVVLALDPAPTPSPAPVPSKTFRPAQASEAVDAAIREAAATYNMPRWFYYALIQRESSFDSRADNGRDKGLTQLGGEWYTGSPYPEDLPAPDDTHQQYDWDMNFKKYGPWIRMTQVTPLDDYFDPRQNLDRFSTGYAVPAFLLFKRTYGLSDEETLRRVAFHWNKGMYATFDPDNQDYLAPYDKYVAQFKPLVEAEDGPWNGHPAIP